MDAGQFDAIVNGDDNAPRISEVEIHPVQVRGEVEELLAVDDEATFAPDVNKLAA